ncbi:hypothetical protein BGZ61DRAFT_517790 [Ilyonectria robusta]|uniref:uncharacterized protein n=1 Tax=Ilyonectria robusta TaxID=1079257 RepID=UPI001E8DD1E7|nr:uncharacterized protein BGZ61DRAFT_517790 [Ilyonectria robusta]KAH8699908.1 hypothetical protein BGZ61DRAFT_517790 [Ilyonectria robusta]
MIMADDEDMIALIVLIVHTSSSNDTHKISLNGRDGTCCRRASGQWAPASPAPSTTSRGGGWAVCDPCPSGVWCVGTTPWERQHVPLPFETWNSPRLTGLSAAQVRLSRGWYPSSFHALPTVHFRRSCSMSDTVTGHDPFPDAISFSSIHISHPLEQSSSRAAEQSPLTAAEARPRVDKLQASLAQTNRAAACSPSSSASKAHATLATKTQYAVGSQLSGIGGGPGIAGGGCGPPSQTAAPPQRRAPLSSRTIFRCSRLEISKPRRYCTKLSSRPCLSVQNCHNRVDDVDEAPPNVSPSSPTNLGGRA